MFEHIASAMRQHATEGEGIAEDTEHVHAGVTCDGCGQFPLSGRRWKCSTCTDYDLCDTCHKNRLNVHEGEHQFEQIRTVPARPFAGLPCSKGWCKGKGKGKGELMFEHVDAAMRKHVAEGESASKDAEQVHVGVTCDGCGQSPLTGRRWKCSTCANYDLCDACFETRSKLHMAEHSFAEVHASALPFPLLDSVLSWSAWLKGKGKGKGKHCWARHGFAHPPTHADDASSSESWSSPSSSDDDCLEKRSAQKRLSKQAKVEARLRFKAEMKALKEQVKATKAAFKQEKHDLKVQQRDERRARRESRRDHVVDVGSLGCSSAVAATQQPASADLVVEGLSPLQQLAEMGFDNVELMDQLLEKHENDVQKVLLELLS